MPVGPRAIDVSSCPKDPPERPLRTCPNRRPCHSHGHNNSESGGGSAVDQDPGQGPDPPRPRCGLSGKRALRPEPYGPSPARFASAPLWRCSATAASTSPASPCLVVRVNVAGCAAPLPGRQPARAQDSSVRGPLQDGLRVWSGPSSSSLVRAFKLFCGPAARSAAGSSLGAAPSPGPVNLKLYRPLRRRASHWAQARADRPPSSMLHRFIIVFCRDVLSKLAMA